MLLSHKEILINSFLWNLMNLNSNFEFWSRLQRFFQTKNLKWRSEVVIRTRNARTASSADHSVRAFRKTKNNFNAFRQSLGFFSVFIFWVIEFLIKKLWTIYSTSRFEFSLERLGSNGNAYQVWKSFAQNFCQCNYIIHPITLAA